MSTSNFTPAPPPYPTVELIAAVADILRYIDKRRANANAAALTTDEPKTERPPAPKVKKEQKH